MTHTLLSFTSRKRELSNENEKIKSKLKKDYKSTLRKAKGKMWIF